MLNVLGLTMAATSYSSYSAPYGRIGYHISRSWRSRYQTTSTYLEATFTESFVTKIASKGDPSSGYYVKSYTIYFYNASSSAWVRFCIYLYQFFLFSSLFQLCEYKEDVNIYLELLFIFVCLTQMHRKKTIQNVVCGSRDAFASSRGPTDHMFDLTFLPLVHLWWNTDFLTMAHYRLVCTRIPLSTIQTMPLNILYTYIFALLYITTLLSLSTRKSVGVEIRSSLSLEDTNPLIGASPRCVERNKYTTHRLRMGSKQVPLSCMENVSLPNVQKTWSTS